MSVSPVQPASWCHWRSPDSDREGDPSVGRLGVGIIAEHLKGTLFFPVEGSEGDYVQLDRTWPSRWRHSLTVGALSYYVRLILAG